MSPTSYQTAPPRGVLNNVAGHLAGRNRANGPVTGNPSLPSARGDQRPGRGDRTSAGPLRSALDPGAPGRGGDLRAGPGAALHAGAPGPGPGGPGSALLPLPDRERPRRRLGARPPGVRGGFRPFRAGRGTAPGPSPTPGRGRRAG